MEFEDIRPTSDADRRLAEAKKLTLQPLHTDIAPDVPTDSEIAARHVNEPPIANVSTDTEDIATRMRPTQSSLDTTSSSGTGSNKLLIGIVLGTGVFMTLAALAFMK